MTSPDISTVIAPELPYLRRYARALTGSQSSGDTYAIATLEAIVEDRDILDRGIEPRVALFQVFHGIWQSSGSPTGGDETGLAAAAQALRDMCCENDANRAAFLEAGALAPPSCAPAPRRARWRCVRLRSAAAPRAAAAAPKPKPGPMRKPRGSRDAPPARARPPQAPRPRSWPR